MVNPKCSSSSTQDDAKYAGEKGRRWKDYFNLAKNSKLLFICQVKPAGWWLYMGQSTYRLAGNLLWMWGGPAVNGWGPRTNFWAELLTFGVSSTVRLTFSNPNKKANVTLTPMLKLSLGTKDDSQEWRTTQHQDIQGSHLSRRDCLMKKNNNANVWAS